MGGMPGRECSTTDEFGNYIVKVSTIWKAQCKKFTIWKHDFEISTTQIKKVTKVF